MPQSFIHSLIVPFIKRARSQIPRFGHFEHSCHDPGMVCITVALRIKKWKLHGKPARNMALENGVQKSGGFKRKEMESKLLLSYNNSLHWNNFIVLVTRIHYWPTL